MNSWCSFKTKTRKSCKVIWNISLQRCKEPLAHLPKAVQCGSRAHNFRGKGYLPWAIRGVFRHSDQNISLTYHAEGTPSQTVTWSKSWTGRPLSSTATQWFIRTAGELEQAARVQGWEDQDRGWRWQPWADQPSRSLSSLSSFPLIFAGCPQQEWYCHFHHFVLLVVAPCTVVL